MTVGRRERSPHVPEVSARSVIGDNRSLRQLLLSNVINLAGSSMSSVALTFGVLKSTNSPSSLGLVLASNALPSALFLLVGGVLADRLRRVRLIVAARLASALIQTVAGLVLLGSHDVVVAVSVLSFALGAATTISRPASDALVRDLVPRAEAQVAFAALRLPSNVIRISGPFLAGLLIMVLAPGWLLLVDAATYVAAAVIVARIRSGRPDCRVAAFRSLRLGFREFLTRRWFLIYTVSGSAVMALWQAGYTVLGPAICARHYGGSVGWGIVQGGMSAGMVIGAAFAMRFRMGRPLLSCVVLSGAVAIPLIAMGLSAPIYVVVAASVVSGVFFDIAIVCWSTVSARCIPPELLGRLGALNLVGEQLFIPFATAGVGLAAGTMQSNVLVLGCAALVVVTTIVTAMMPSIRNTPAGYCRD